MDTALKNLGWFPLPEDGKPICCGRPVEVATFIGWPYSAMCTQCHKFMFSALAPNFGNSWVQSVDSEQYDFDDPEQWIWGKER